MYVERRTLAPQSSQSDERVSIFTPCEAYTDGVGKALILPACMQGIEAFCTDNLVHSVGAEVAECYGIWNVGRIRMKCGSSRLRGYIDI